MDNIHASCVFIKQKGILILGDSGSGKSDLCLRLIMEFGAKLVADDRVDIKIEKKTIIASAPQTLKGLLEVRGVGIIKLPAKAKAKIDIVVSLVGNKDEIERLPEREFLEFGSVKVSKISLFAKEASAPAKVLAALTML